MSFITKLQDRWDLKSAKQVWIVLLVFAATGTTIYFLKKPIIAYFNPDGERSLLFNTLYFVFILPVYNLVLLFYGAVFGQFNFFWEFEKKTFRRITGKKAPVDEAGRSESSQ